MQSHILLGNFLDANVINKLVSLFDQNNNTINSITAYINNERKKRQMNTTNITTKSEVYGQTKENSTLYLKILKNNEELIHLTIHLIFKTLNPAADGMIHFYKDIFEHKVSSRKRYKLYVPILVVEPVNKPHSLEFSIASGYTTLAVANAAAYDPELQQEMNTIISVLNKLFDEDSDLYIGDSNILYPIHNETDIVLNNINSHTQIVSRKNKGVKMMPKKGANSGINIYAKNKKFNKTRKHRPIINIESNIIQQSNSFNRVMPNSNQPVFHILYNKNKRKTQKVSKKNI